MISNIYLAFTVPALATNNVVNLADVASPGNDPLMDLLTSGGVLSIALGLGWFLLRRSDEREHNIRQQLKDELDHHHKALLTEQSLHQESKEELIYVLKSCRCTLYEEEE